MAIYVPKSIRNWLASLGQSNITEADIDAAIADEITARNAAIVAAIAAEVDARNAAVASHASLIPSPFIFGVPAAPLADGALAANQISFWSNDGVNLLGFKMKNSAGVVKTGTVALT